MLSTLSLKLVVLATAGTLAVGGTTAAALNPTVQHGLSQAVDLCRDAMKTGGIGKCVSAAAHLRNEKREELRDAARNAGTDRDEAARRHGDRR